MTLIVSYSTQLMRHQARLQATLTKAIYGYALLPLQGQTPPINPITTPNYRLQRPQQARVCGPVYSYEYIAGRNPHLL